MSTIRLLECAPHYKLEVLDFLNNLGIHVRKVSANRIVTLLSISWISIIGSHLAAPVMGEEGGQITEYEYCTLLPGITKNSIGKFLEEFKSLNLTDDQKKKVSEILLRHQKTRIPLESDFRLAEIELNSLIEQQIQDDKIPVQIPVQLQKIEGIHTTMCMHAIKDTSDIFVVLTPAQRERWSKLSVSIGKLEKGQKEPCPACETRVTLCPSTGGGKSTEKMQISLLSLLKRTSHFGRLPIVALFSLSGCLSPIALEWGIRAYDNSVADAEKKLLLLNIARASDHQPPHFSVAASIAATFNFSSTGTAGGEVARKATAGTFYNFSLGATLAENPTFTIVPMQGEEFTKRLLTPVDEWKVRFLDYQGKDPQILLRLLARGVELEEGITQAECKGYEQIEEPNSRYRACAVINDPKHKSYTQFRQILLHLWSIYRSRMRMVPLDYYEDLDLPLKEFPDLSQATAASEQYSWRKKEGDRGYIHIKQESEGAFSISGL